MKRAKPGKESARFTDPQKLMHTLKSGPLESRRNWSNCFKRPKTEDWHSDFSGVMVLENGDKYWVNIFEKKDRNNNSYLSVALRRKE